MKKTIKYKIIEQVVSHGKTFTLNEFHGFVWWARHEVFRSSPTYANALQSYISEGLIEKVDRNKYVAGDLAETYLKEPKNHRDIVNERKRMKRVQNYAKALEGTMIQQVVWLNPNDVPNHWSGSPVVIRLSNGMCLMPMRDEEGNDAGSLSILDWNTYDELQILGRK